MENILVRLNAGEEIEGKPPSVGGCLSVMRTTVSLGGPVGWSGRWWDPKEIPNSVSLCCLLPQVEALMK